MSFVSNINIIRRSLRDQVEEPDLVAIEEPLEIRLGYGATDNRQQRNLSVTMRTPGHDNELALGFLLTEGIIRSYDEIESVKYCESARHEEKNNVVRAELKPNVSIDFEKLQRHFYTSSSCGVCGKSSIDSVKVSCMSVSDEIKVKASLIQSLPALLRKSQEVFEHTGGLHASALFDSEGTLLMLREDVGRHNAFDKIIGAALLKNEIPLSSRILLLSGRASFELIQKAAIAGIPIVAAIGAPSSLAVSLADELGITLLGFVKEQSFNVYTHAGRIE
jgi:FdhD protein